MPRTATELPDQSWTETPNPPISLANFEAFGNVMTAWTYRNCAPAPAAAKPACSGLAKAGAVAALAAPAAARLTAPAVAKAASKTVIRFVMLVMVLASKRLQPLRRHQSDDCLINVAPPPVFARFERLDDRVPGLLVVRGGVLVRRGITAANVAAVEAEPQVHPGGAVREAFLAAVGSGWLDRVKAFYVRASGHPAILALGAGGRAGAVYRGAGDTGTDAAARTAGVAAGLVCRHGSHQPDAGLLLRPGRDAGVRRRARRGGPGRGRGRRHRGHRGSKGRPGRRGGH